MSRITEASLGPPILAYLQDLHWDCYQEVTGPAGVADIVGTLGHLVCTVELKTGLGFDVLEQALRWKPWAHWSWIAVPAERVGSSARFLACSICRDYGVGVLELRHGSHVFPRVLPALQRRAHVAKLRDVLRPEHKTFAPAGTATSRRWTPFQETCKAVREFLATQGGAADVLAVVKGIEHHYSADASARACLVTWAEAGKISGVEVVRGDRKKMQLRLTAAPLACEQP